MRDKILAIIEKNARLSVKDIAALLGEDEAKVSAEIEAMENEGIICGYHTLINWDKTSDERVDALIEVKVAPQRGMGFDSIAERIYQYEEVESCYLMSGGYDVTVIITGRTLREVALFVSEKLSTIDGVTSTATHFILKKYKQQNVVFEQREEQRERLIFS